MAYFHWVFQRYQHVMMKSTKRIRWGRSLAGTLAIFWAMLATIGAVGLNQSSSALQSGPASRLYQAKMASCRCITTCPMNAKHPCCCKTARTVPQRAIIASRCSQDTPSPLTTFTHWPLAVPPVFSVATPENAQNVYRLINLKTISFQPAPPNQPPCLS